MRTRDVFIVMKEGIGEYHLHSKHALSNTDSSASKYLIDTPTNPFKDDALKIIGVYSEIGQEIPINDKTKVHSVFTPSQLSLQIPWMVAGDVVNVVYRANHEKLPIDTFTDIDEVEINLAPQYLEPLLFYIAYRYFNGIAGQASTPIGNGYLQRYIMKCAELEVFGLTNQDQESSTDLYLNNWA
jgi:hypothetical protein